MNRLPGFSLSARPMPARFVSAAILAMVVPTLGLGASPVLAANPVVASFSPTGAEQQWTVPAGVTSIHVDLVGGAGGSFLGASPVAGGVGAHVTGDLTVSTGTTIFVEVAGNGTGAGPTSGSAPGGFNGGSPGGSSSCNIGGAGGGGASDLRTIDRGSAGSAASRLIVAAGGGGAANDPSAIGGAAGLPGGARGNTGDAGPGGPGSAVGGGAAGAPGTDGSAGSSGAAALGGLGGAGGSCTSTSSTGGGGGGGGGYYGGGGGGGAGMTVFTGQHAPAGGGGGSTFTGAATNASSTPDATGQPSVTISYVPDAGGGGGGGADTGSVGAQVTVPSSAACLEVSTATIDFGTLPLGSEDQPATPSITVTNCSALGSDIYAHGSDAAGVGAAWTLADTSATCADTLGTNNYRLGLEQSGSETGLGTTNKLLESLAGGATGTHTARIWMACPGSTGAGATMSMQVVFLATTGG
jgi:Glycine rich protein